MAQFDSLNPATGAVIASHEIYSKSDVDLAVQSAHGAKVQWQKIGFKGRLKILTKWKKLLLDEGNDMVLKRDGIEKMKLDLEF